MDSTEQAEHISNATPDVACNVCGRILDWVIDGHTRQGRWQHTTQDRRNETHKAVPVPVTQATTKVVYRCDFCNQDTATWTVHANDFQLGSMNTSIGDWCSCDLCVMFVIEDDWPALIDRVVGISSVSGVVARGEVTESDMRMYLSVMYRTLSKHLTDPPSVGIDPI